MAYSSWIQSGNELVNSFGDSKRSHFYLKTLYKYERNGNTVNYIVRLELNYVNDQGGTGSYGWNMGVKAVCNGSSDPGYQWISGGGTWSNGANVGAKEFSFSITNTTGTGTVPIASAAQNTDRNSFDAPGWYYYNMIIPQMDTYTVTYNANGGSGAPANQTKQHNVTLTLSTDQPTKADSSSSGLTVTYNGNNGSVDKASDTSYIISKYTFTKWNTKSDGSGTDYLPGASYTANAAVTLYAQYSSTSSRQAIALPGGSRGGYSLTGFGTSASSTTPVANPYTPSANITLYAIWSEISKRVKIKNGNNWVVAPIIKIKSGGNWYLVYNVKIKKNGTWQ